MVDVVDMGARVVITVLAVVGASVLIGQVAFWLLKRRRGQR